MTADVAPQTQHGKRVRPAIDEIAQAPQLVPSRVEAHALDQVVELAGTALHVSYQPAHAGTV